MQRHLLRQALATLLAFAAASCSDSTSPQSKALDGAWTTGHACLTLGLDLSWTDSKVGGSGTYRTDDGPLDCTPRSALLAPFGNATLEAGRPSPTTVSGTLIFDTGVRATFTAALVVESGGARMNVTVVPPDGTVLQTTLIEGLIP